MGASLSGVYAITVIAVRTDRAELLQHLVSAPTLVAVTVVCLLAAAAWTAVIVRTYQLARPRSWSNGRQVVGVGLVVVLCAVVALPLGIAANLAHSQRSLLNSVFASGSGSGGADGSQPEGEVLPPRLNLLLLGSDAGPDREGTRTDTMIVASIDTETAATVLFALPRNIQDAPFPGGSPAAAEFPDGFPRLLNAVYGYGAAHPDLAPAEPTDDPGANLLMSSISHMLGLDLHHYVMVDMAGLEAVVDALGGVTVDVGSEPLPIGGVTYSGRLVEPDGWLQPGVHHLNGFEALWYARSRRNSDDYDRMGRQRCLIQAMVTQNSPADLLLRFRSVADATTDSITTDIPQHLLPPLVTLVDEHFPPQLRTVSFDPDLPDPSDPEATFRPARPDIPLMRQVVDAALVDESRADQATAARPAPATTAPAATAPAAGAPAAPTPVEPTCGATPNHPG